LKGTLLTETH